MTVTITNQNRVIVNYKVKGYLQECADGGYKLYYKDYEPMFVFDREDAIDFIQDNLHQFDRDTEPKLSNRVNQLLFEYEYNYRNIINKKMKKGHINKVTLIAIIVISTLTSCNTNQEEFHPFCASSFCSPRVGGGLRRVAGVSLCRCGSFRSGCEICRSVRWTKRVMGVLLRLSAGFSYKGA